MKPSPVQERALAKLSDVWQSAEDLDEREMTMLSLVRHKLAVETLKTPNFPSYDGSFRAFKRIAKPGEEPRFDTFKPTSKPS